MNILLTLNRSYLKVALIMLKSLYSKNRGENIKIFVLSKDLKREDFPPSLDLSVVFPNTILNGALTTHRYPEEMYYRLFAFEFLPKSVEKVLYLDPDVIINKNLRELYDIELKDNYVAGSINKIQCNKSWSTKI